MRQSRCFDPADGPWRIPLRRISYYRFLIFAGKGSDDERGESLIAAILCGVDEGEGRLCFEIPKTRSRLSGTRIWSKGCLTPLSMAGRAKIEQGCGGINLRIW